jgi:NAD(P)H-flavin reductase
LEGWFALKKDQKRNVSENLVKFKIKASREICEIKPGQYVILTIEFNRAEG